MVVSPNQIAWSSYDVYEGPFFRGTTKYALPKTPTVADEILAVITTTEGGTWNAINMYDRCICTVGLIQWCEEGQYSVSDMLGATYAQDPDLLAPLTEQMRLSGVAFRKNAKGRYRFFFIDKRGEIDRREEQQQLFLLGSTGRKGDWDASSRAHAKAWAAALATVYENRAAIEAQRDFTVPRLFRFAMQPALRMLDTAPHTSIGRAFVAAYLSFAANSPRRANDALVAAQSEWGAKPSWTKDWLVAMLRSLTFHSRIAIYPHRYNAIRPVLERLYNIDLPDLAESLGDQLSPAEIQQLLVRVLGYDLGKSGPNADGVDGAWGPKSRSALTDFQRRHDITGDGLPGPETNKALLALRDRKLQ